MRDEMRDEMSDGKTSLADVSDALQRLADDKHSEARLNFSELPDHRKVADLSRDELNAALKGLKIPGASTGNSLEASVALYERFLQRMEDDDGGELAVLLWFLDHEDDEPDDSEKDDDR
ncbi:hypothetical protein KMZ68_13830 [Bradyrhizobium sediminis]|uniref:Uncharacterized protein n=1 Tax=Bradyrhizobium sediminis TaxID=2840469 RepID=A0A975RQP2_9BRAD|nr:hypothetical protein [Bradyrhizobium sediminis]QWG16124.1 hypothetical protein KMZ68_13830 [Bradyrhizobium sediminis]